MSVSAIRVKISLSWGKGQWAHKVPSRHFFGGFAISARLCINLCKLPESFICALLLLATTAPILGVESSCWVKYFLFFFFVLLHFSFKENNHQTRNPHRKRMEKVQMGKKVSDTIVKWQKSRVLSSSECGGGGCCWIPELRGVGAAGSVNRRVKPVDLPRLETAFFQKDLAQESRNGFCVGRL